MPLFIIFVKREVSVGLVIAEVPLGVVAREVVLGERRGGIAG